MGRGIYKYSMQEAQNLSLGLAGAYMCTDLSPDYEPPTDLVFVAIQVLDAVKFDTLESPEPGIYISTASPGSETVQPGEAITSSDTFPTGVTIFGRWNKINLNEGKIIAYLGG